MSPTLLRSYALPDPTKSQQFLSVGALDKTSVNSITVEKQPAMIPRKRRALNRPGNGLQSADHDQRPLPMLPKQA